MKSFSSVMRFALIRLLLAVVANLDLELHQMDIKIVFLNREFDEEIYMKQPVGYNVRGQEHIVHKLNKSIYGLNNSLLNNGI